MKIKKSQLLTGKMGLKNAFNCWEFKTGFNCL